MKRYSWNQLALMRMLEGWLIRVINPVRILLRFKLVGRYLYGHQTVNLVYQTLC